MQQKRKITKEYPVFSLVLQTPYYWPSQNHNPENSEYLIYLYKRSLRNKQKHGLEDYELVQSALIDGNCSTL